jgi:DNA-binding IclR family transcriptional regulator
MSLERALQIVKTLEEHKALGGFSVDEIAQELGQFPSDVEQEFKSLQKVGAIKCYMFEGKLYAVYEKALTTSEYPEETKKTDIMFI